MLLKSVLLCNKHCHSDEIGKDVNTKGEFNRYSSLPRLRLCSSNRPKSVSIQKIRVLFTVTGWSCLIPLLIGVALSGLGSKFIIIIIQLFL
jgi:hypothetical protein